MLVFGRHVATRPRRAGSHPAGAPAPRHGRPPSPGLRPGGARGCPEGRAGSHRPGQQAPGATPPAPGRGRVGWGRGRRTGAWPARLGHGPWETGPSRACTGPGPARAFRKLRWGGRPRRQGRGAGTHGGHPAGVPPFLPSAPSEAPRGIGHRHHGHPAPLILHPRAHGPPSCAPHPWRRSCHPQPPQPPALGQDPESRRRRGARAAWHSGRPLGPGGGAGEHRRAPERARGSQRAHTGQAPARSPRTCTVTTS